MRFKLLLVGLVVIFSFLQYRLWFESGGIREMLMLRKNLAQQNEENEKLKRINEELLFQINRLKESKDSTESHARNELGMIKKGETFYQIVK